MSGLHLRSTTHLKENGMCTAFAIGVVMGNDWVVKF